MAMAFRTSSTSSSLALTASSYGQPSTTLHRSSSHHRNLCRKYRIVGRVGSSTSGGTPSCRTGRCFQYPSSIGNLRCCVRPTWGSLLAPLGRPYLHVHTGPYHRATPPPSPAYHLPFPPVVHHIHLPSLSSPGTPSSPLGSSARRCWYR